MDEPKPTGRVDDHIVLVGGLMPWLDDRPLLLRIAGSPYQYITVFSTLEKLKVCLRRVGVPFKKIKRIDDTEEFLATVPEGVEVIYDPWWTDKGTIRYKLVVR